MRGVALCQLIPGATMVQIVTYVGYRVRGIWGALTAAVAFVLPAFIALLILRPFISDFILSGLFKPFQGIGRHCGGHHSQCLYYLWQFRSQRLEGDSHRSFILLRILFPVELCSDFCFRRGCRFSLTS